MTGPPTLQPVGERDSSLLALGLVAKSNGTAVGGFDFGPLPPLPSHAANPLYMAEQTTYGWEDGKNTHKGRSSSLSALWKPSKKDGSRNGSEAKGHLRQQSEIQYISSPLPPGTMDASFTFPDQQESISSSGPPVRQPANAGRANVVVPAVSPSASEKRRNQYSLRRMFLHRKSNSSNEQSRADNEALSPSISAPWGLTVASFRPVAVADTGVKSSESTPDLRQLSLENSILVSRESDSNGLLAQSRARDMPPPTIPLNNGPTSPFQTTKLERSKSLGQYGMINTESSTVASAAQTLKPRRYEASTMCEKFVLPRPRLVALTITPPSSPPDRVTSEREPEATYSSRPEAHVVGNRASQLLDALGDENRGPSPALSGYRVLREGVLRDREREEWATHARTVSGQALRMRLPSAGKNGHQDRKYQIARFAPQPVAFEPVYGLDGPSDKVYGLRNKERSGSLGNIIAVPSEGVGFAGTTNLNAESGEMEEIVGGRSNVSFGKRRASEPTSSRRMATTTFLRQVAQTMRSRKPWQYVEGSMPAATYPSADHIPRTYVPLRKSSLPAPATPPTSQHRDKPLPPEPIDQSGKRSSAIRHSVSSPNLRTMSETELISRAPDAENSDGTLPDLPSRDSTISLFNNSVVAGRLAHPLGTHASMSSTSRSPPAPIQISPDTAQPAMEPFTPTRQAAWDQWHTMPPRSPSSPVPERLPLDTVLALASRQLTSPRQKRPSMEEAVNRARIANRLFGDAADNESSSGPGATQIGGEGGEVIHGESPDRFPATTTESRPRESQYAIRSFSPKTPRTAQLFMATPGSTEASPMPGASFDDIERVRYACARYKISWLIVYPFLGRIYSLVVHAGYGGIQWSSRHVKAANINALTPSIVQVVIPDSPNTLQGPCQHAGR